MYVKAIEEIQKFTRPVHSIVRYYHSDRIHPGAATLFFVNESGVAVTCKHVVEQLLAEHNLNAKYAAFKSERELLMSNPGVVDELGLKELESKYNYSSPEAVAQLKNQLVNCTDSPTYDYLLHSTLDLAILKFRDVKQYHYTSCAIFLKDGTQLKQGRSLCRYGFPFAEFRNFAYDPVNDEIDFTKEGISATPSFPMDGILTRHVAEGQAIVGIEMSTPGLKGQSGGPLFDASGIVCGMQAGTAQYHMGFDDKEIEIISKGGKSNVFNHSFLNVGRCVHVEAIKAFLRLHNVKFYEQ
jgi:hypothetical protein